MDNQLPVNPNPVTPPPAPIQSVPPVPIIQSPPVSQAPQPPIIDSSGTPKDNGNIVKIFLIALVILIILGMAAFGYFYFLNGSNKANNATIYNPPASSPTPTIKPSDEVGTNDNSNQELDKDSEVLNKNIINVTNDLNAVDQSLNDQQTNLQ